MESGETLAWRPCYDRLPLRREELLRFWHDIRSRAVAATDACGNADAGMEHAMKVKIDIDLSPLEARELMGLPDVRALQQAWLEKMNKKMEEQMDQLTPDAMVQNWMKAAGGNAEFLADMMSAFMNLSSSSGKN